MLEHRVTSSAGPSHRFWPRHDLKFIIVINCHIVAILRTWFPGILMIAIRESNSATFSSMQCNCAARSKILVRMVRMYRALITLVIRLTPQFNPNILHALIFRAPVRVICYYNCVDTITAFCIIIANYNTSFDLHKTRISMSSVCQHYLLNVI